MTKTKSDEKALNEHEPAGDEASVRNPLSKTYGVVVVLDPDVAEVFKSAVEVNAVLRALIQTMPAVKR